MVHHRGLRFKFVKVICLGGEYQGGYDCLAELEQSTRTKLSIASSAAVIEELGSDRFMAPGCLFLVFDRKNKEEWLFQYLEIVVIIDFLG